MNNLQEGETPLYLDHTKSFEDSNAAMHIYLTFINLNDVR